MAAVTLATIATAVGISAATAATIGAVAAVVVNVSMYVGLAGLALKVVGAVTGNKTLNKIGTYMGYAGLIGGIAGAGVGALADATAQSFFEQGTSQMIADQAYIGAHGGITQTEIGNYVTGLGDKGFDLAASPYAGMSAPNVVGQSLVQTKTIGEAVLSPVIHDSSTIVANQYMSEDFLPSKETGPAVTPQGITPSQSAQSAAAELGETAPAVSPAAGGPSSASAAGKTPLSQEYLEAVKKGAQGGDPRFQEKGWGEWWKSVDPSVKAMGGLAVGQTAAGAAQGWFAGQSAEEKLAFDKYVNTQRQDELNRRIRNASYAPRVYTGPTGLLQQGGA